MNDMESRKFEDAFKQAFEEAGVSPSDNVWTNIERTMDDMESRKFGGAFLQAFDDAGVRPSDNVWINIELDLMRAEGGKMKRRLVFFQLLAAASIAFAFCIAGVGYYILQNQQTGAAGPLAYHEGATGTNATTSPANTSSARQSVEVPGTIPSGTRSTAASDGYQAKQDVADITSHADGQNTDAATTGQSQYTGENAVSSPDATARVAQTSTTTSITTSPKQAEGDDTRYVAGASRPHTATTTTTPNSIAQRNDAETTQGIAALSQSKKRAPTTVDQNAGSSTDRGSLTNQGQTHTQQTVPAATRGMAIDGTVSNPDQQQMLNGVTVPSVASKNSGLTQQSHGGVGMQTASSKAKNNQQQLAATQQPAGVATPDRVGVEAESGTGQNPVRLARTDETHDVTRSNTAVASANQSGTNAHDNPGVTMANVVAPVGAYKQKEYRLAYSPMPSRATPAVTSLGTRVQKPASMKVEPASTVDPLMALLARLDEQDKSAEGKEKKDKRAEEEFEPEKLWTSVGFAAGSFNTINSSVSGSSGGNMMMADARKDAVDKVASQQAKASGSSYSVGLSLGTRISSRWVLQGGVNYMTQASDYTASAVGTADFESFQAPSVNSIMSAEKQSMSAEALSNVVPTAPYNVNNSLQFVSVPVQAGYLLVNRKVGVQLNGGLSTDLFIQNTITPEGENLEKETKGNGSDSPYRTVNFSGLVGTELTYRFSKHYRLALNPGLRYPLNSIYKSDQPVTAAPLTFDIGLRFRYIFH